MATEAPKKVVEVLTAASEYLADKGVDNPGMASKLLLSRLLKCKHLELSFKFNDDLSEKQLAAMRRGIKRVGSGEPVQYVVGETGFMGHNVKVDERALIPRPETEVLVETVLACDALWNRKMPVIVDVGTGSGCIVISLAKAKPDARFLAFDTSADALSLARENAEALGVADRIGMAQEDLADALEPQMVNAVICNLPYIPTDEYEKLPVHIKDHEPREALDGGPSGLRVIESVIFDAAIVLKPDGFIFLEIAPDQAGRVSSLLAEAGFDEIRVKQDLAKRDRIVWAVLQG
jgi:release factor glutamine methyltransferase